MAYVLGCLQILSSRLQAVSSSKYVWFEGGVGWGAVGRVLRLFACHKCSFQNGTKLSLSTPWRYVRGVELQYSSIRNLDTGCYSIAPFVTSTLDGREWSVSRPGRCTTGNELQYLFKMFATLFKLLSANRTWIGRWPYLHENNVTIICLWMWYRNQRSLITRSCPTLCMTFSPCLCLCVYMNLVFVILSIRPQLKSGNIFFRTALSNHVYQYFKKSRVNVLIEEFLQ
jgi:hypothetical protein